MRKSELQGKQGTLKWETEESLINRSFTKFNKETIWKPHFQMMKGHQVEMNVPRISNSKEWVSPTPGPKDERIL